MPAKIYSDPAKTINESMIAVRVSDNYETKIPGYYRKHPERLPFYYGDTPDCYSMLPISRIIELCVNGTEFTIINRADVLFICGVLQGYVDQVEPIIADIDETTPIKVFVSHCKVALGVLRHVNTRATTEQEKECNITPPADIISLLSKFSL